MNPTFNDRNIMVLESPPCSPRPTMVNTTTTTPPPSGGLRLSPLSSPTTTTTAAGVTTSVTATAASSVPVAVPPTFTSPYKERRPSKSLSSRLQKRLLNSTSKSGGLHHQQQHHHHHVSASSWASILFGMACVLSLALVSIQFRTLQYHELVVENSRSMMVKEEAQLAHQQEHDEQQQQQQQQQHVIASITTVDSQMMKRQFLKGSSTASTEKRLGKVVEQLKKDHTKELLDLKEQIIKLEQQLQQREQQQEQEATAQHQNQQEQEQPTVQVKKQQQNKQHHEENEQHSTPNLRKSQNNDDHKMKKKDSTVTTKKEKKESSTATMTAGHEDEPSSNTLLDLSTAELREKNGYSSPVCTVQVDDKEDDEDDEPVFDRIYFLHMRKAGGSSLRSYFEDVQLKHNITVEIAEGQKHPELPPLRNHHPNDDEENTQDDGSEKRKGRTLYVTHIREPIARTISHYKYEHRWLCKEQLKQPDFVPSNENVNMNLTTFITDNHLTRPNGKLYWECASDCYAKWFTGYHPATKIVDHVTTVTNETTGITSNVTKRTFEYLDDYNDELYKQELQKRSLDVALNGYHLVIVSEWLKDEQYLRCIERLFGVKGVGRREWMMCRVPTKKANLDVPLEVTDEEMDIMKSNNQIDSALHKKLMTCGNDGNGLPQFANRKPFKFASSSSTSLP